MNPVMKYGRSRVTRSVRASRVRVAELVPLIATVTCPLCGICSCTSLRPKNANVSKKRPAAKYEMEKGGQCRPCRYYAALERAEVLLIDVTAKLVSLLLVAFSWSRISLKSLCASSCPRSLAHSRSEP